VELTTHNEVRHDKLDIDSELLGLLTQCLTPSLEESFAAGVGGEHSGGDEGRKGADSEDEAAFAGEHGREKGLSREEGGFDVLQTQTEQMVDTYGRQNQRRAIGRVLEWGMRDVRHRGLS
jgi:hypothetical protein